MSDSRRALRVVIYLVICLCLSLTYVAGFGAYRLWHETRPRPLAVFWEAWDHVERNAYYAVPSARERTYAAIHASLALLDDPYTIFIEPQTRELERDHMRGAYGGIGVDLWRDAQGQMALSPYPDSPAQEAGLREGDIVLAVDGQPITSATAIDAVRALLHGEAGTAVTLRISRPPPPSFDLTITRAEIQIPSVTWRVLDQAPQVGYVHIQGFTSRTEEETVDALRALKRAPVTALVLDLRDNSGGLIDPAVATASQFLSEGVVLYERRRDGYERTFSVRPGGAATDIPLAVLVNQGTASAAEIVAGALQDRERAPLIGETTYGKGAVQLIYELSDGSSLHVTSAVWFTPHRHEIHGHGLTPDIIVPPGDGPRDVQLDRALEHLRAVRE